jgi:hypothetical protein
MPTLNERITEAALKVLKDHPDGIRYAHFVRAVQAMDPDFKTNTVHGTVWDLHARMSDQVYKPSRGLFRLTEFRDTAPPTAAQPTPTPTRAGPKEEDFYQPFADWLVNDLEECTKAIPLGGSRFRDRWGTPDVLGKRESKSSDILKVPTEIISAEIKTNTSELITAFGQACSYCLFSHRAFLVIPNSAPQEEIARVDSLCQVFGIGLILFDPTSPETPEFEIRARPRRQEPDMYYANKYMAMVEAELFD